MDSALKEKAEIDKLVFDYSKTAKKKLNSAEIILFEGTIFSSRGYLGAAIDNFKKALEIKPDYTVALNNLGIALKAKGDYSQAIESFGAAVNTDPAYVDAYINLGISFNHEDKFDLAILNFNEALKIQPDHAEAHLHMSESLDRKGEFFAAIDSCNRALKFQKSINRENNSKKYRIIFRYLSSAGGVDQTFYTHETEASSEQEAISILKECIKDVVQIRIDKVVDTSPQIRATNKMRIRARFKNKSRLQISFLIFGGILMLLGMISKFMRLNF